MSEKFMYQVKCVTFGFCFVLVVFITLDRVYFFLYQTFLLLSTFLYYFVVYMLFHFLVTVLIFKNFSVGNFC